MTKLELLFMRTVITMLSAILYNQFGMRQSSDLFEKSLLKCDEFLSNLETEEYNLRMKGL